MNEISNKCETNHLKHNVHHHQQTSSSTKGQINNFEVVKNTSMFSTKKTSLIFLQLVYKKVNV